MTGGYPETFLPLTAGEGVEQDRVFDPALRHHPYGFRAGEPVFRDPALGHAWRAARRAALDHVLTLVTGSEWGGHLVLRGSMLLATWFPGAAREPGDLDYVMTPPTRMLTDDSTARMFTALVDAVREHPAAAPGVIFRPDQAASDDIWTYERAPGRRLVFPWGADGLPDGTVQVDVVFNETLPEPPVPTTVIRGDGTPLLVPAAASPALSLAWKIAWLVADAYPEGKDLYDAVLLAEHTALPWSLLHPLLARELSAAQLDAFSAADILELEVEREVGGTGTGAGELLQRLAAALTPTFAQVTG